jgi:hypothetical protein
LLETPGAYPRRKYPIGLALALPSNSKTQLERASKDKRSSLLGLVISDEGKEFYHIDTWCQCDAVTFGITTFSTKTLRENIQYECRYAGYRYAECDGSVKVIKHLTFVNRTTDE